MYCKGYQAALLTEIERNGCGGLNLGWVIMVMIFRAANTWDDGGGADIVKNYPGLNF